MGKQKIASKGYTLTVESWENDGDYYNTQTRTVPDKEYAIAIAKFLEDCISPVSNNGDDHEEHVEDYLKEHGEALGISSYDEANDLSGDLLGWSEHYTFRVPNSIVITYTKEDIYLEEINF